MGRLVTVSAAQLGPIGREEKRAAVVRRLLHLMEGAKAAGADLVVYPELALTSFFPRWVIDDPAERARFYETAMPGPETQPLFDAARRLGIGFFLGYAEKAEEGGWYNSSVLVDKTGTIIGKYRKVHLPGTSDPVPGAVQQLERRYFDPGNLGFPVFRAFDGIVGMCLCNDRRWPETYRVMALQGVELVLLGYNTPAHLASMPQHDRFRMFHNHLPMQAGAYQNTTFVVGVAKAGLEEGEDLIGGTCIIAPTGEIVAEAKTLGDELVTATIDLDEVRDCRAVNFDFALYRRPDQYRLITERAGAVPPTD
jgi:predicted amidohydrolase